MFTTIDRYIGKTVLQMIFLCLTVLMILTALITFIDKSRYLGTGDIDFAFLMWYVVLLMPNMLVMMFPVSVLLGTVIGLGMMAKSSELVIVQNMGKSRIDIVHSAGKMVIPLVLLVCGMSQTVIPEAEQYAQNTFNSARSEGRLSRTGWGTWIREGDSFVFITRVMSDGSIHQLSRYDFEGTKLTRYSTAKTGIYNAAEGTWDIFDVKVFNYEDKRVLKQHDTMQKWALYINPERLEVFNLRQGELNVIELYDYIKYLDDNHIDSSRYRISMYMLFLMPVIVIVMMLLGASAVFGPLRSVALSARALLGMALGFSYYIANQVLPTFIVSIGIPPIIGVLLPSIFFIGLAFYLLNRKV